ncbi:Nif3-like dinuclear metal center hexameric protein [Anaerotignum lactatifermentans]|uniref:GTP cyclohydrolase 1 type 2 homolog n=1 Tax=Anaerotignum lactatifermentans TaxID=160404 RepID=A0ABS2GCN8_9FIRM|nr:Nif3-like dinuclear metal center hexameric protein [Anaerotignum lactatifermentans]MBM6829896.1 Nif3-like dinuclear metal center hexameric protein [Anaerotignum lactatifermentans]MBM6878398.1 Nif3-like dinuclear metal center hexameric protein [Anaerotignum lactatifermentans]MBM6951553.1 Nif3-like dinuclear metal center hexameric protein [Anaerotignum lactatifermentans]
MVRVKDIMAVMEGIAPGKLAEGWDRPGLAVGRPEREVKKILVALDVTKEVIAEAIEAQAELIVTHHPMLLFQKFDSITPETPVGEKILTLAEHKIAAFSAHTNLDVAKGGTNDVLAELIGLEQVEILEETWAEELKKIVVYVPLSHGDAVREAMCQAGAGHIGNYACCTFGAKGEGTFLPLEGTHPYLGEEGKLERAEEIRLETIVPASKTARVVEAMLAAHPYEEVAFDIYAVEQKGQREGIGRMGELPEAMEFAAFAKLLKEKLGLDSIRLTGDAHKMIKRVALCTGSGAEFVLPAHAKGADAYLTGDIKFHEAQKAVEAGICVADVTHYASEVLIVPVLQKALEKAAAEKGWELEVLCSKVNGQTFWSL